MQAAARYRSLCTPWRQAAGSTEVSMRRLSSIRSAGSRWLRAIPPERPPSRNTWSGRSRAKKDSTAAGSRRSGASGPPTSRSKPSARSRRASAQERKLPPPAIQMRALRSMGPCSGAGARALPKDELRPDRAGPLLVDVLGLGVVEDDLGAAGFEAEGHVDHALELLLQRGVAIGIREQQQEAAASGAEQLPAHRARGECRLVDVVELAGRDLAGEAPLR